MVGFFKTSLGLPGFWDCSLANFLKQFANTIYLFLFKWFFSQLICYFLALWNSPFWKTASLSDLFCVLNFTFTEWMWLKPRLLIPQAASASLLHEPGLLIHQDEMWCDVNVAPAGDSLKSVIQGLEKFWKTEISNVYYSERTALQQWMWGMLQTSLICLSSGHPLWGWLIKLNWI